MTKKIRCYYTALEDVDFLWDDRQLQDVRDLWNDGRTVGEMARYFKRKPIDMYVLILDQLMTGAIERGRSPLERLKLESSAHYRETDGTSENGAQEETGLYVPSEQGEALRGLN